MRNQWKCSAQNIKLIVLILGRKEAADRIASETNGEKLKKNKALYFKLKNIWIQDASLILGLIIHPYDDYNVIAGQGTIGKQFKFKFIFKKHSF